MPDIKPVPELFIGLMSGTSLDGIDAALVDFSAPNHPRLVEFFYQPFSSALRKRIHDLSQANQPVMLLDFGTLDALLGSMFAAAAQSLLDKANISAHNIRAIGSHGQTVYHAPETDTGFSLQIADPNRIAQITGITTVADFRRRDIAVGGQGAPLVPIFHQAVFTDCQIDRTIINIGGIANITVLDNAPLRGFDTGPGNTLMDYWCHLHSGQAFDRNGDWAASGQVIPDFLTLLMTDDYFHLPPPKSTGKEYFSISWLNQKLDLYAKPIKPEDVQTTLCQLTATSIAKAIRKFAPATKESLVCGGGAHNKILMDLLEKNLQHPVHSTANYSIHPDHVEACAFAWLARQTLNNLSGNACSVTGAREQVILGGIYPGQRLPH